MKNVVVSIICPNCGNTVVLNVNPTISGGIVGCCYNCSATVSCCVSWNGNNAQIYNVRSNGGIKK